MTRSGRGPAELFAGPSEMEGRCRSTDWAATPLGPVERWPAALAVAVRTCLDAPFPIAVWCGPRLVAIYNDAYRRLLADRHPDALGKSYADVWPDIWDQVSPLFDRIRSGGAPVYQEDAPFYLKRDGHRYGDAGVPNAWFTFSLSPVRDDDNAIIGFLNIASETTPRIVAERERAAARVRLEHAEARLREMFAQAPAFMAVLRGPELVFEYANEAYYRLVGHRDLIGRAVFDALPEVRGQGFEAVLAAVLNTGQPFVGRESPIMIARQEGDEPEQRYVDFIYYPLTEPDGTRTGVVAHGYDVTPHVLARREAQHARTEAERANHAKSQFLANMSHEIRTPINAIMGYSDLMQAGVGGALTEKQDDYLRRVRASSRHLLNLVNDVLDLSKVEAGQMRVEAGEHLLDAIAQSAIQMVAPQAEARRLQLRHHFECDHLRFVGDENRVRQIILNLLSNAVKFTPPGGRISLECLTADTEPESNAVTGSGPWALLAVEDTGPGIDPGELTRIFDPFVQAAAKEGEPRASGTGLGLTISRRFARLMGGDLTVQSTPGVGSRFVLWLPRAGDRTAAVLPHSWPRAERLPSAPGDVPGLGVIGQIMKELTEAIVSELIRRLRAAPELPAGASVDDSQLSDHTAPYLSTLAKMLMTLDAAGSETGQQNDGQDIVRIVADRHGLQRRRLGWSREQLQLEYRILHDILDTTLRREATRRNAPDPTGALGVLHLLLDEGEGFTMRGFETQGHETGAEHSRAGSSA